MLDSEESPACDPDRRPIASRDTSWAKAASSFLARCGCSPNGISLAGMFAGIAAGVCFAMTRRPGWEIAGFLLGAACVQLRLLANMFDGMVAIETGRRSPVGELYNEAPDRVSDVATLVGAGYAAGGMPELGYSAAILAVLTAYVRAAGKAAGAPNDFCGPMAKPHRMFVMTVAAVVAVLVPRVDVMSAALGIVAAGSFVTVLRRLLRTAAFLRSKGV